MFVYTIDKEFNESKDLQTIKDINAVRLRKNEDVAS